MKPGFRLKPYLHQQKEWDDNKDKKSRALLWQMRTGKTKACIDLACYWREEYEIDGVLIIAPNGVHLNWILKEIAKHHWLRVPHNKLSYGTDKARVPLWGKLFKRYLKSDELFWFAINSESMTHQQARKIIKKFMKEKPHFLLLVDESHDFRIPGSKRTKMSRAIAPRAAGVRIMTGTAVLNSPLHAYSQFELLKKGALGFNRYSSFERRYAEYAFKPRKDAEGNEMYGGKKFRTLIDYKNLDELRDRMDKFSSTVLREDCEDLPEIIVDVRYIEPSNNQLRLYRQLHKQFTVELEEGGSEISIGENSMRLIKLQQVLSGFLIDEYGESHFLKGKNPRLDAAIDEVIMTPGKTIIWCRYRNDIKLVTERLKLEKIKFVEYHGSVSGGQRLVALDRFQNEDDVLAFVGQPASAGLGLDLSAASHILWYTHIQNTIQRKQADERATKMGGEKIMMTNLVVPNSVDEYILSGDEENERIASQLTGTRMLQVMRDIKL